MSENMRHRSLLLAVCGWAVFMLLFVSKFITLSLRDKEEYGNKPHTLDWTATRYVKKAEYQGPTLHMGSQASQSILDEVGDHWESIHTERLNLLKNMCRNASLRNLTHSRITKFVLDRIFVCDKHKILFCQTPKVGNTQWKKVLIVLNGILDLCLISHPKDDTSDYAALPHHFIGMSAYN
uniref:Carbohydrate sulfotransferase n=1 Tax=Callorhinchus milii TaxID=7868 RepID=V9LF04_CALMI